MSTQDKTINIAIAGATGFVGQALLESLSPEIQKRFQVIGLTRSPSQQSSLVEWRDVDLFSLKSTEQALAQADVAVYLVHSMMPQARLVQAEFQDIDLLLADNFARACRSAGVRKIVYLGGILPQTSDPSTWSKHLKSRHEVESTLSAYGVPVITLRSGLIVGANGSSFSMMIKLVERLPVMLCPKWTQSISQPVDISDCVEALKRAVFTDEIPATDWDLIGPTTITYMEMLDQTAARMQKKRLFLKVPLLTLTLSRYWVSLVTGFSKELVKPLVMSLRYSMVGRAERDLFKFMGWQPKTFHESLNGALQYQDHKTTPVPGKSAVRHRENTVVSIQRIKADPRLNTEDLAREYCRWIIRFMFPVLKVEPRGLDLVFRLKLPRWNPCLLYLSYSTERSTPERQLFYVTGGLLSSKHQRPSARLEFRRVRTSPSEILSMVLDFKPALPWRLYKSTQAVAHGWVMRNFRKHLLSHSADLTPSDPEL